MHALPHIYIHIYMHTYVHTYIHACMHTHIYTYIIIYWGSRLRREEERSLKSVSNYSTGPLTGEARRVVGNIWCVDAGEPSSRSVRDVNSGNPRRLTSSSLAQWRQC